MCIAVMGLMNEPWEKVFRPYTPAVSQMIHVVFAALGIFVLYYKNSFEIYGFLHCFQSHFIMEEKAIQAKRYNMHFIFLSCASDSAVCDRVYIQVRNKK